MPEDSAIRDMYKSVRNEVIRLAQCHQVPNVLCILRMFKRKSCPVIEIEFTPLKGSPGTAAPGSLEEEVLNVLRQADQPLKAEAIARRCGRGRTSHFKRTLSSMRKNSLIRLETDGYRAV